MLCVAALLALPALPAQDAAAEPDASPTRLAGPDRVATAAEVVEHVFAERGDTAAETTTALVARDDAFPDALAAAGLAGATDAPVLLTHHDELPARTREALDRLDVGEITLLGGEKAITAAVAEEARQRYAVDRLAGEDRYATAAELARAAARHGDGGAADTVLVVRGDTYADALTAGPAAFADGRPVLLTHRDRLAEPTAAVLDELAPRRALVLGGPAAVGDAPVAALRGRGIAVERIAGPHRAATAAAMADHLVAEGWPAQSAVLARGDDFADALAAAPLAGRARAPILLAARPATLGGATSGWLAQRCPRTRGVQAVGGAAALTPSVLDDAHHARLDCTRLDDPVTFGYRAGVHPDTDAAGLVETVAGALDRPDGWALDGAVRFRAVDEEPDLAFHLADPDAVAAADPHCRTDASCRVGDEVWLNADRWRAPPSGWDGTVGEYRRHLVNHLVGHWLGVDHAGCAAATDPVMVDQTDAQEHCQPAVRPTAGERERVRQRHVAPVDVAFAGDVHGEGRVGDHLDAGGNPLEQIAPVLSAADLAVVNLETAVGTGGAPQPDKAFTFQAPPAMLPALVDGGVDVVSVANNHALDYGAAGLSETLRRAADAGLHAVGAGPDEAAAYQPAVFDLGRRRVAVVGLSRVLPAGWAAGAGRAGLASGYDVAAAEEAVRVADEHATHVVVAVHWGEELAECPVGHQRDLARRLTAAGADVVAGHHPHVLQGTQRADDALIGYSLGNFVWYHSRQPSRYTGVWTVELGGARPQGRFTAAEIDGLGRPVPATGMLAQRIHADVDARSPGGDRCAF